MTIRGNYRFEIRRHISTRDECRWPRADAAVHQHNSACTTVIYLHAPRVSQLLLPSYSFPVHSAQQIPFLGTKVPFTLDSQEFPGISSKFQEKAGKLQIFISTREGPSARKEFPDEGSETCGFLEFWCFCSQFGSCAINWMLTYHLVQRLSWVFATPE